MIIIIIIGVASGILLTGLGTGQAEREVEAASRELVGALREAQGYALTGRQIVANTDPCRFQVSWGGGTYSLTYWYKDSSGVCNQSSAIGTYTLKRGVAFSNTSAFYFTLPHAGVSFGGASAGAIVSKAGITRTACTYADGRIQDVSGGSCP
ncbi:MAG: hypothetical protein A2808_00250 [Candidatus Moranbacteria bacterium RIFCSPHIGHO2_01_FULL_55_24]|nr:MAG: hypothetical protein A2808_00250 [Candidatus Moranbacteria bacterium RIFCSPHIGHO2_01_FULL_55_24]